MTRPENGIVGVPSADAGAHTNTSAGRALQSPDEQAPLSHDWELGAVAHKDLEPAVVLRYCSHAHLGKEGNCFKRH